MAALSNYVSPFDARYDKSLTATVSRAYPSPPDSEAALLRRPGEPRARATPADTNGSSWREEVGARARVEEVVTPALDPSLNDASRSVQAVTKPLSVTAEHLAGASEPKAASENPSPSPLSSLHIYTDGSVRAKSGTYYGGIGVYFGDADPRNVSETVEKSSTIGSDTMEFTAVLRALQATRRVHDITIWSDSAQVVDTLCDSSEIPRAVGRKDSHQAIIDCSSIIKGRSDYGLRTAIRYVQGHSGNPGNTKADALAGEASRRPILLTAKRSKYRQHSPGLSSSDGDRREVETADCQELDSSSLPVALKSTTPSDQSPSDVGAATTELRRQQSLLEARLVEGRSLMDDLKRSLDNLETKMGEARIVASKLDFKAAVLQNCTTEARTVAAEFKRNNTQLEKLVVEARSVNSDLNPSKGEGGKCDTIRSDTAGNTAGSERRQEMNRQGKAISHEVLIALCSIAVISWLCCSGVCLLFIFALRPYDRQLIRR